MKGSTPWPLRLERARSHPHHRKSVRLSVALSQRSLIELLTASCSGQRSASGDFSASSLSLTNGCPLSCKPSIPDQQQSHLRSNLRWLCLVSMSRLTQNPCYIRAQAHETCLRTRSFKAVLPALDPADHAPMDQGLKMPVHSSPAETSFTHDLRYGIASTSQSL